MTTPTLDLKDNMTDNQQESSPNENLVDDSPPDLLEKKSSIEQESATNPKDHISRNQATNNKEEESKDKKMSDKSMKEDRSSSSSGSTLK